MCDDQRNADHLAVVPLCFEDEDFIVIGVYRAVQTSDNHLWSLNRRRYRPGGVRMLTLIEMQAEVERRASLIGASGYVLPTFGHSEDGDRPYLEVDARGYHYVVVERGE